MQVRDAVEERVSASVHMLSLTRVYEGEGGDAVMCCAVLCYAMVAWAHGVMGVCYVSCRIWL